MVLINDLIHIYVDFNLVVSTASPDDALGLLIAMYTIFELSFNKKSRTIRFLYSLLHSDKRFLSNSIRIFIKEKKIDLYAEQQYQSTSTSSNSVQNIPMSLIDEQQSQLETNEQCNPSNVHNVSAVETRTEEKDSTDTFDSNSKTVDNINRLASHA